MAGAARFDGVEPGLLLGERGEILMDSKGRDAAIPGAAATSEPPAIALLNNLRLDNAVVIEVLWIPLK